MPDIVVDDPEYNQLTNNQKQLLQELVKPEADALQEFYESELAEMGKLEDLDHKHSKKTFVTVSKLLSSGLSKAQIKSLITILNIEKVDEIEGNDLFDIDDIDEDEASQTSIDRVGFDCNHFHWTLRCVDELDEYMVTLIQSKTRGNQSRLKSKAEGRITMRQKLADESKVKDQLRSAGFGEEEIEYHYQNHYLKGSLKKKKKGLKKKSKGVYKMRRSARTARRSVRRGVRRVARSARRSARRAGKRVRSRRSRSRRSRASKKCSCDAACKKCKELCCKKCDIECECPPKKGRRGRSTRRSRGKGKGRGRRMRGGAPPSQQQIKGWGNYPQPQPQPQPQPPQGGRSSGHGASGTF
jgi:hypothetical protein